MKLQRSFATILFLGVCIARLNANDNVIEGTRSNSSLTIAEIDALNVAVSMQKLQVDRFGKDQLRVEILRNAHNVNEIRIRLSHILLKPLCILCLDHSDPPKIFGFYLVDLKNRVIYYGSKNTFLKYF